MTVDDISRHIFTLLGLTATPSAEVVARVLTDIDRRHRELLSVKGASKLRHHVMQASSTANVATMAIPRGLSRIRAIVDRDNLRTLDPLSLQELRALDPGLSDTSSFPTHYVELSQASAVAVQPSAPSSLWAKSTSAADGAGVNITIYGVLSTGQPRSVTVPMNGVTAVSFSAINTWATVQRFTISPSPAGTVTLHEGSGAGPELASLVPGQYSSRYTVVHLYPKPTVAVAYYIDADIALTTLASFEEPLLPEDFHDALIDGALMWEWERRGQPVQYAQAKARFIDRRRDYLLWLQRPQGVGGAQAQTSQLGPFYPPGS